MASTSTNKQPLLIDRVFNNLVSTSLLSSGSTSSIDIVGTNSSGVVVDCTTNDGGLVEDLWAISRASSSKIVAQFYLSTAVDYLRQDQGVYVGEISIPADTAAGTYVPVAALPKVLAPVPQVGNTTGLADGQPLKNTAFYVPSGKALWVTIQRATTNADATLPIIGAQGGFF